MNSNKKITKAYKSISIKAFFFRIKDFQRNLYLKVQGFNTFFKYIKNSFNHTFFNI